MKRLLLMVAVTASSFSFSQAVDLKVPIEKTNDFISEVFGPTFLTTNPQLVTTFQQLLNQRISYLEQAAVQGEKYPLLSSYQLITKNNPSLTGIATEVFRLENFNPLQYDFGFFSSNTLIIRIDGTKYLMVVKPQK